MWLTRVITACRRRSASTDSASCSPTAENRLWLDISDPGPDEVELLRREFGFHELALEDVTRPHERPRCDAHGGYYFIVVYAAEQTGSEFRPRELNLFWGENYLVTIHRGPAAVLAVAGGGAPALGAARGAPGATVSRVWRTRSSRASSMATSRCRTGSASGSRASRRRSSQGPRARRPTSSGSGRSCFGFPACSRPRATCWPRCSAAKRAIPDGLRPYFADVQDHALHVLAELDTYRDLLGAALDVHVFYAFNRLGHIMKRLTAVTVIIMVPNFVASIYGMNFAHLLPPSEWQYGFVVVVAFLACMVAWASSTPVLWLERLMHQAVSACPCLARMTLDADTDTAR